MTTLERLGAILKRQCDGEWEKGSGVLIESCSTGGWFVQFDAAKLGVEILNVETPEDSAIEIFDFILTAYCPVDKLEWMLTKVIEVIEELEQKKREMDKKLCS
jgi:hypothetical protein